MQLNSPVGGIGQDAVDMDKSDRTRSASGNRRPLSTTVDNLNETLLSSTMTSAILNKSGHLSVTLTPQPDKYEPLKASVNESQRESGHISWGTHKF